MRLGAVFPQAEFRTVDPDEVVALSSDSKTPDTTTSSSTTTSRRRRRQPAGWTGYYNSSDPFLEPLVLFAYLARSAPRAGDRCPRVAATPDRARGQAGGNARAARARPHPPRCRDRLERRSSTRRSAWTSFPRGPHGGADPTAASALDRAKCRPRRHVGRDRCRGSRAAPPGPVPIWIGSAPTVPALARVGRLADGWLPEPAVQPGRGFEPAWIEVRRAATPQRVAIPDAARARGPALVTPGRRRLASPADWPDGVTPVPTLSASTPDVPAPPGQRNNSTRCCAPLDAIH